MPFGNQPPTLADLFQLANMPIGQAAQVIQGLGGQKPPGGGMSGGTPDQFNLPPNVAQKVSQGNIPGAAGAALRDQPTKNGLQTPKGTQAPPGPQNPPTGPQTQGNAIPINYAQQIAALQGQIQNPGAPPTLPNIPLGPSRGQAIGSALSAMLFPRTTPFVEQGLNYDQARAEENYKNQYQAALDNWRNRVDATNAANEGLSQQAEILKAASTAPQPFSGPPLPTQNPGETSAAYQQRVIQYWQNIASQASQRGDKETLNDALHNETEARQNLQAAAGFDKTDMGQAVALGGKDPLTGQAVNDPNDQRVLNWVYKMGRNNLQAARLLYVRAQVQHLSSADRATAERVSQGWSRLSQQQQQFQQREAQQYNIDLNNNDTRLLVAHFQAQASAGRQNQAEAFTAALQQANAQDKALAAAAPAPVGNTPAAPAATVPVNIKIENEPPAQPTTPDNAHVAKPPVPPPALLAKLPKGVTIPDMNDTVDQHGFVYVHGSDGKYYKWKPVGK